MAGLTTVFAGGRSLARVVSNVKGYSTAVRRKLELAKKNMKKAYLAGARDWERETKRRCPKVTGQLARTFQSRVTGRGYKVEGQVGSADPRSLRLEFGTRPYVIVPRKKKLLAFWTPRGFVLTKRVRHPGIKVGTPRNPRKGWRRQTQRHDAKGRPRFIRAGQRESMPYLRPAWLGIRPAVLRRLRKVF